MKKSKTLVIVVIYPEVEKFLEDYISTVLLQTEQDFDLLILNDHADIDICKIFPKSRKIIEIEDAISPAQIRYKGISYAIRNQYKNIVFTDADDYYSKNRISLSKEKLEEYSFVFNEIDIVNSEKEKQQSNILLRSKVKMQYNNIDAIIDKNYFGLSNTAVNVKELKALYIPEGIIAVDWWIFTLLLLNGRKGVFIKEAKTYYRQSEINLVGFWKELNKKRLWMGIKVKTNHYKNLIDYCFHNNLRKERLIYNRKFTEMKELNDKIRDSAFRKTYIDVLNKNYDRVFNGWWSEILSLSEWRKYAN